MSEIKDRLKLFRKDKNLTQEDVATQTAISRTYISTIEAGRQDPSFSFVKTLSKTYGLSIDWLLTGEGEMMRGKGEAEEVASAAVEALSENRMLEKIVLMLADMSEEERREVFDHVQKAKRLSDLEQKVKELEAERAG